MSVMVVFFPEPGSWIMFEQIWLKTREIDSTNPRHSSLLCDWVVCLIDRLGDQSCCCVYRYLTLKAF